MTSKKLINISNLQKFLSKLNEKFALKKAMKGISEDSEGNIIIGEEGLVPTPNENSKGKFLRSDGEWALPSETAVYDSMTIEEGVAGVSEVDRVINAKNLKQIVNSDGFLTSLDSSKLTGVINIENLPQGALERILIVSSKEERLTLLDTEVQLGDVVKEADTGLMYYVINTEKLNSEEGYTQFTAGSASSVPWSGVTNKPTIPTKTSELTNDSGYITNVTWEDVIDKPELSQVAISGTYSDLNNTPTIPTKTSQLINDSGFLTSSSEVITSVSWTNITDKPNFATVATSGSYNDLSNKPTIPNVYNKTLTIQKNGTNVATFTSNSNTDVTANITVPTKVSELSNDSGFITGISWDKVTNKPTLAKVATSGSYTDLSNTPTIPTKVSQLENDTGFINALTDVVDTKSNQTINGIKTFTSTPFVSGGGTTTGIYLKNTDIARNKVPSTTYYSVLRTLDKNNEILGDYVVMKTDKGATNAQINIRSEDSNGNQLINAVNFSMANDNSSVSFAPSVNNKVSLGTSTYKWAKIYSDDVVHTSGNEYINGTKMFSNTIHRYADLTTSGVEQVYRFDDTNANPCGHIYNNVHWYNNAVFNRHGAYNAKSGKSMEIDIISYASGDGMAYVAGTASKGNIETVTSETGHNGIATMGWVNNPATSTNVVHRTGNEAIAGFKSFTEVLDRRNDVTISTVATVTQLVDTNANRCGWIANRMHWSGNYHVHNRHIAYNENSGKEMYIDIISSNDGSGGLFVNGSVTNINLTDATSATGHTALATMGWVNNPATSTNVVHRSGDETIAGNKTFSNKIKGNLQGNADTATSSTKSSYLDNYSLPGGNRIYLDWDKQVKGYVGLKVDTTVMGGLITTNNIGSQSVNSATYSTTPATSDNSTKIATTAWVRNYVGSVGSVGVTFVKTDNGWYRKHSDGFIEQFFYITSVETFKEKTINFHIPFTTIHYNISVIGSRYSSSDPNRTDDLIFTNGNSTPTYAKLYVFDGGDNNYYTDIQVYVCGY